MIITSTARDAIQVLLDQHKVNGLRVVSEGMGCSGPKIGLILEELDQEEITSIINGIPVAIERQIRKESKKIKLDVKNDQLVMLGTDSCC
ncbi:hypothetical protein [Paenibacillus sp. ATY16]|uniref:hypothetical protein n=1 Tax=Paenibacillus sp. ATY16 TaxID=1759312 RepID=UPI00200FD6DE|nr:hypothetical protein [Paenibacillus sp. ATY16]MCK9859653.1 hypothetical protein [Paenibacillus sp. ATY16]